VDALVDGGNVLQVPDVTTTQRGVGMVTSIQFQSTLSFLSKTIRVRIQYLQFLLSALLFIISDSTSFSIFTVFYTNFLYCFFNNAHTVVLYVAFETSGGMATPHGTWRRTECIRHSTTLKNDTYRIYQERERL
jgi:hypothetical protein